MPALEPCAACRECVQLVADLACDHLLVPYAQLLHSEVVATEENEIARLRRENGTLKTVILSRGLPLPARGSGK